MTADLRSPVRRPAVQHPAWRGAIVIGGAAIVMALLLATLAVRAGHPLPARRGGMSLWLIIHLATVIPALPLGAWVLIRRKGDALHRALGKLWAVLMMVAALSSFGLQSMASGLSPIHLLSVLTLVSIPRAIWCVRRGDIAGHQRSMTAVYIGLVLAGLFAFVPGRLLGVWLFL